MIISHSIKVVVIKSENKIRWLTTVLTPGVWYGKPFFIFNHIDGSMLHFIGQLRWAINYNMT